MQDITIGLKVDVDTHVGLMKGVPALAQALGEYGIQASFYVSMGPDNSGRAIRRVFTQKNFLRKMLRTGAAGTYGLKTTLYGTLLPGPLIGCANGHILRWLEGLGHEVGPHGWDHIRWHDCILHMPAPKVEMEIDRFIGAYRFVFDRKPIGSAAPGWQCSETSLLAMYRMGLRYSADTRGTSIFLPVVNGEPLPFPQIPTTLPTLDELIGSPELAGGDPADYLLDRILPRQLNVYTLHAEFEGMAYMPIFRRIIEGLLARGARFAKLCDLADEALRGGDVPPGHFKPCEIPGRAGYVVCQV